jgi:hypothetical protein
MLKGLLVAVRHDLFHALHVLALGLHQARQILAGLSFDRSGLASKKRAEPTGEVGKSRGDPWQRIAAICFSPI